MNQLLYANFSRLKKDIFFRIGVLFLFAMGILMPLSLFSNMKKYGYPIPLESGYCFYVLFMAIFSSVFCSLFIGTEYNDGTMRNKLIAGHSRIAVYFSFLIVSITAVFLMCLAYLVSSLCTGIPLLGFFSDAAFPVVLGHVGAIFILAVAFTAICTAVAMLCQNKATTATVCILGVFLLLFLGVYIHARLEEPEYYETYYLEAEEAIEENTSLTPNPSYISGTKRQVYEFLHDFLPGNQAVQLSSLSAAHLWKMSFYSLLIAVAATGTGIYIFYRENIN